MEKRMMFRESVNILSKTEQQVLDYVEKNMEKTTDLTIEQLAEYTYTSRATITRFIKKLGFKTYAEFKIRLGDFCKQEKVNLIKEVNRKLLEISFFNNDNMLDELCDLINESKQVFFIGSNSLKSLCTFSTYKYNYYSNKFYAPTTDYEVSLLINNLYNPINNKVVAFFFSFSGNSKIIVQQASLFKRQGSKIVAITNTSSNKLSAMSDYHICLNDEEIYDSNLRLTASGIPHLYILEALYYTYIDKKDNIEIYKI